MKSQYAELKLPDSEATPEEIAMGEFELIPGVNVPRDQSASYQLTPKVVEKVGHVLKEDKKQNP